jgi:hypothetical protein
MYGDTLKSMKSAFQMYRQIGFSEVIPYSSDPTPGAIFSGFRFQILLN